MFGMAYSVPYCQSACANGMAYWQLVRLAPASDVNVVTCVQAGPNGAVGFWSCMPAEFWQTKTDAEVQQLLYGATTDGSCPASCLTSAASYTGTSEASTCASSASDAEDVDAVSSYGGSGLSTPGSTSKGEQTSSRLALQPTASCRTPEQVWRRATKDEHGSRDVQVLIEAVARSTAAMDPDRDVLICALHGRVVEACKDESANFVVREFIEKLPKYSHFIVWELFRSKQQTVELIQHNKGYRSILALVRVMSRLPREAQVIVQQGLEEIIADGPLLHVLLSDADGYAKHPLEEFMKQPSDESKEDRAVRDRCRHHVALTLVAVPDNSGLISNSHIVEELLRHSLPETFRVLKQAMLSSDRAVRHLLLNQGGTHAFGTLKKEAAKRVEIPLYKEAAQLAESWQARVLPTLDQAQAQAARKIIMRKVSEGEQGEQQSKRARQQPQNHRGNKKPRRNGTSGR
mmetsp:Transcript_31025/g.70971  ORF Transcript_31025/g.70971 Transcript_31025/m.70971 type:complete len:460 (-) Transcript_31025:133-1512(-)